MNRKRHQSVALCLLILVLSLCLWSCSEEKDSDMPAVDPIEITVSIDYPAKSKLPDITEDTFRAEEESSVLQIIELYGNVNDISILVDTTNSTLEGINGIISHVYGKNWEWRYRVNGDLKKKDIDDYELEDGDHLEFVYVHAE